MGRLRSQAAFTLVEVLVAWSVLLFAIVGTLHAFAGAQRGTSKAEQRGSMVVVAQRELERLRGLPYAQIGMSPLPGASAEAPRTGLQAAETLVDGGSVDPGPTPFSSGGVSGRIYRYVTWRQQSCPLLTAKVGTEIDTQAGVSGGASAAAELADLCPGSQHTKRVVVAVVADDPAKPGRPLIPVRAHTIVSDPASGVIPNPVALAVDRSAEAAATGQTAQDALYENSTTQTLYLYDTPCSSVTRQPQGGDHATHDTGRKDHHCGSGSGLVPDLMGLTAPPDGESANDYSSDLLRSPADGLALKRDDRSGTCTQEIPYEPSDAEPRKWSVHRWSTRPFSGAVQTLMQGGRATLTLWSHTVGGVAGAGRLCVILRRPSNGEVLGVSDFQLAHWPTTSTQLAISFDLAHATLAAGERLTLIVRNHPDSDHDLELMYDRDDTPAALTLTMTAGQEIS
jgi:type II secretory pathway pseudopilin PulG